MEDGEFDFFSPDTPAPAGIPASPLQRLQYLVDNTPAIIYAAVPSGDFKMTFVSSNACNVLGYRPEEMVADANFWFDHIHPDDAPHIFSSLALLFTQGQRSYEYRFRAADGRYLWMHDQLRLIRDAAGAPLEVVGSLTDISARKQMEEQLLQAEKMASIGQLAAGIAHEINNPVGFVNSNMGSLKEYVDTLFGVIDAYQQVLLDGPGAPVLQARMAPLLQAAELDYLRQDATALVRESLEGLRRVRDIVQALKDFTHVGEAEWQLADLHKGLDSTLNIVANELKLRATVAKDYAELPLVRCHASQLNQVFVNLLVNAAQAMQQPGVIRIATGVAAGKPDWVWVRIADSGAGIAPEHLQRIFEPFFTTKPVGSGTGLGLSLSYRIVQRHGGHIDVSSAAGQGTAFTVHLPVHGRDQAGALSAHGGSAA